MKIFSICNFVKSLFSAIDKKDWNSLPGYFTPSSSIDYRSLADIPVPVSTKTDMASLGQSFLTGFDSCRHNLERMVIQADGDKAHVICESSASFSIHNPMNSCWNLRGAYHFDIISNNGTLKISNMKYVSTSQTGNSNLPKIALKIASENHHHAIS
jgi:hypothetical protein